MKNTMTLLAVLGSSAASMAQCGMTVSGYSNIHCMSGFVEINTSGGTPPYTIEVRKLPQNTVMGTFADADGNNFFWGGGYAWEATGGARVTVTDAASCTATMDVDHNAFTWTPHMVLPPVLDCASGTFRVNMSWFLTAPQTFRVDNGPVQNVGGNWIANGSSYVLNTALSPGAHTITFPEHGISFTYCETSHSVTVPNPVSPGDCGVNLRVRTALDGALPTGTIMTDGLRTVGLIPTVEPYTALGYTYTGTSPGVSIPAALLTVTGNDAVVDWVVIELRSSAAPYGVLYSKPALLQRDGDVIDTDGDTYLATSLAAGSYHVAIRHRNHLGAMTGQAYQLGPDPLTINFRSIVTYGSNAVVVKGGVGCLWAGDVTGNGTIAYTGANNDRDPILVAIGGNIPTSTLTGQYRQEDVNLDGVVKYAGLNNDRDPILVNIGGTTPTNTRTQQLP
ncbi:MAG: hypothetical protein ABI599_00740 [Flavobacteriales bacterium]